MKLRIVPAGAGANWVKLGIRTFFRQPLALSGLFILFMAAMSLASLIPFVGAALALALLPAATLGFMAGTREAVRGNFPMPAILVSAFRAGQQQMRAMWVLGALYAAGFLLVMGVSALFDGGQFAKLYLVGGTVTREIAEQPDFQIAMLVAVGLYLPLSLLFWHAPALVHWHAVPPVKSLFFSIVACFRNFGAYMVYGLVWGGVFLAAGVCVTLLGVALGGAALASILMVPTALLMAAMFFTSVYFTYLDSFEETLDPSAPPSGGVLPPA
ncbi:MAG: BPSS1780 family membrane protein [Burkholderiales bacterium]